MGARPVAEEARAAPMLPQLITAAVIGALSPVAAMATIVLLGSGRPVANTLACLVGWSAVLVALAAVLAPLLDDHDASTTGGAKTAVQLIVGLVLLAAALRTLVGGHHPLEGTANPERPPPPHAPAWLKTLDNARPLKALGIGALLIAVSPADVAAYISGLQALIGEHLGAAESVVILAALVAAIGLCIIVPLAVYLVMPRRAGRLLATGQAWLIANQQAVTGWSAAAFGILLLAEALIGLL